MLDQARLQLLQVRQHQLMAGGRLAGVAQQVADLGTPCVGHVLVHGRVIGRRGLDHPLYFAVQVLCGGGLAAAFEQLGQFRAQGRHFTRVGLQAPLRHS